MAPTSPERLLTELRSGELAPDYEGASRIRDRASALLTDDPTRAAALAGALLERVLATDADAATRAVAWRARAEANLYTGRLHVARRDYERAAHAAEEAGGGGLLGQILVGWIGLLAVIGERRERTALVERARRLLERAHDRTYLGKLYMNLGTFAFSEERYGDALTAYERAAKVFDQLELRDGTWVSLIMNRALACTNLSRIDEARALFVEAERTSRELGLERVHAQALYNRAHLERLRGDYREALSLLDTAFARFEAQSIGDMLAACERERAEIHLELSMAGEAFARAGDAARRFAEIDMDLDAQLCRLVAGDALLLMGRPGRALEILQDTESYFAAQRIWPRRAAALLMIGRAHLARGDLARAREVLRRALRTFRSHAMRRHEAHACRLLAEVHLGRGRAAAAARMIDAARRLTSALGPGDRAEVRAAEAALAEHRGDREGTRIRLRRAARLVEAQHALIPGVELRARAFEHHAHIYRRLLRATLDGTHPRLETVFSLVETSRARAYRERSVARRGSGPASLGAARARLGAVTQRMDDALYDRASPARDRELRRLESERRRLEQRVAEEVRRAERRASGRTRRRGVPSIEAVCRALPAATTLVELVAVDERVLAFVFTRREATMHVLEGATPVVRAAVDSFRLQLETLVATSTRPLAQLDFLRGATERVLQSLYDVLVRPLESRLVSTEHLVVCPTGELHHVPFECLHDGSRYVDERWVVGRRPAVELGGRAHRRPRPLTALIAGTTRGGPPSVREEIEAVLPRLPEAARTPVWNPTTEEILDALGTRDLVHLSAHGVYRDDNPWFSRVSTGDGALFLADLLDRRTTADLVVLSACASGRVFVGSGDDLSGVAHAFLLSGARRLVASHWRVHDRATRELMEHFYDELAAGDFRDPGGALSRARRTTREMWPHPFYWGSFGIHGA